MESSFGDNVLEGFYRESFLRHGPEPEVNFSHGRKHIVVVECRQVKYETSRLPVDVVLYQYTKYAWSAMIYLIEICICGATKSQPRAVQNISI